MEHAHFNKKMHDYGRSRNGHLLPYYKHLKMDLFHSPAFNNKQLKKGGVMAEVNTTTMDKYKHFEVGVVMRQAHLQQCDHGGSRQKKSKVMERFDTPT